MIALWGKSTQMQWQLMYIEVPSRPPPSSFKVVSFLSGNRLRFPLVEQNAQATLSRDITSVTLPIRTDSLSKRYVSCLFGRLALVRCIFFWFVLNHMIQPTCSGTYLMPFHQTLNYRLMQPICLSFLLGYPSLLHGNLMERSKF